ncbi:hypothetical protein [Arthrobacter sp. 18067]|uniref:hypothetical protein n=1 Tax=Arthrobacter sp. 18067 TaxID=2681413 RepID=UPI00135A5182|nr:hypothetical protein [Arthrobacter sp. 18067]
MGRIGLALTLAGTAALLPGCYPGAACPAIGHVAGVSLTVSASYAKDVGSLRLKSCLDGECTDKELVLHPGSVAVDQGCSPEGVCSATSSPDGTLQGFLEMPSISESAIEATVSGTSPAGIALPVRTLTFTPKGDYPYGEQCGRVISAGLVLDADGLSQA